MWTLILKFIIKNKLPIIYIGAAVAIGLAIFGAYSYHKITIAAYQSQVTSLQSDLKTKDTEITGLKDRLREHEIENQILTSNINNCNNQITMQNQAIDNLKLQVEDAHKLATQEAKIEYRYKEKTKYIIKKDKSCEENLKYYEDLFEKNRDNR